jgi:hypothetical protein
MLLMPVDLQGGATHVCLVVLVGWGLIRERLIASSLSISNRVPRQYIILKYRN